MEPNKPAEMPEENEEIYTSQQRAILALLKCGAWAVAFVAMLFFMNS